MKVGILAAYFLSKYSENEDLEADISFGAPISAEKTRILKDKLILVYDKLSKDITQLPTFQKINTVLSNNSFWQEFNRLIINLVNYIEYNNLKNCFNYTTKLIDELNKLRNDLISSGMKREDVLKLDLAIRDIQNTIWKESKRILNIHDLKGLELNFPELKGILGKVVPTWDFGPGKNPAKSRIRQRRQHIADLIKRLEKENKEEK